jgi:hypothetical protein
MPYYLTPKQDDFNQNAESHIYSRRLFPPVQVGA